MLTFRFKPFFQAVRIFFVLFFLAFSIICPVVFYRDNAPVSYYFIFVFTTWAIISLSGSLVFEPTSLSFNIVERMLLIKTRVQTKQHSIPFSEIIGYSLSFLTIGTRGSWNYSSIIIYTTKGNFEIISYNVFSFKKIPQTLADLNLRLLGSEPYDTTFFGTRIYLFDSKIR